MKKLRSLILLLCALGLTACAGGSCALPRWRDMLFLRKHPIAPFDTAQSGQMANIMNGNRVLALEDRLYTLELNEEHRPVLAEYRLRNGVPAGRKLLAENCVPRWLCHEGGMLFYINEANGSCLESLNTDTLERQVLAAVPCAFLQIHEGRLYFRGEQGFFWTASLNGGDRRVVIDKSCCYPMLIGDMIIYQSETEGDILKLRHTEAGKAKEIALTDVSAYAPVIIGDRLYYTAARQLCSMKLDGTEPVICNSGDVGAAAEFIRQGGKWYARGITESYGIRQWRCPLPDGSAEELKGSGYYYCDFLSDSLRVDADYFADGRLRAFVMYGEDGPVCEYLYGKIAKLG